MDTQEFVGELVSTLLPALQVVVLALVGWASTAAAKWLSQKVQHDYAREALLRLNETVFDVVLELEQTTVKRLKAATDKDSPGGVRITADEAVDVKQEAIARVKDLLGPDGIAKVVKVLGVTDEPDAALQTLLTTKVEAAVKQLKMEV